MEKKKSKNFLMWVALGVGALITGTTAYFNFSHIFSPNIFNAAKYSVTVQELLDEDVAQNLVPGQEIPVEVSVSNQGEAPIMVRLQFFLDDTPTDVTNQENTLGWKFNMATVDEGNCLKYSSDDKAFYDIKSIPTKTINENGEEVVTTCKYLKSITYLGGGNVTDRETSEYTTDKSDWATVDPSKSTWNETKLASGQTGEKKTYKASKNMNLKVKVETIQSTTPGGEELDDVFESGYVDDVKEVWKDLNYPVEN